MKIRSHIMGIAALLLLAAAGTAHAQGYGPPPRGGYYRGEPGIHRYGLVLGGSIGPGGMTFSDCNGCDALGALAGNFEIGGMVAPNVAILFDWTGFFHPEDNGTLSSNMFSADIRFFFARILWLQGGIGVGRLDLQDDFDSRDNDNIGWGLGGVGAFGVEVLQTYNFALDLQVRVAGHHVSNDVNVVNAAFMVGIHWY